MPEDRTPVQVRRFTEQDWKRIAESIFDEFQGRKGRRADREKQWDEVDRQLRMEPKPRVTAQGKYVEGTQWMPLLELPWQSQALEIHTADARAHLFPVERDWFSAHVNLTDDFLEKIEFKPIVSGDKVGVPSQINQDDANALIEGVLTFHHSLYDFRGVMDRFNAEAVKYGTPIARARMVDVDKSTHEFRSRQAIGRRIPALMPLSIKSTYLDDSATQAMHEGFMIAPSIIRHYFQSLDDLRLAAKKGSNDPTKENGGWMPNRLRNVEPTHEDKKSVEILEFEGDLIVPRSRQSMFLPNKIVTVVKGSGDPVVFRYRDREFPFRSYLYQPYHLEGANDVYGTGPLLKGMPVQKMATEAWNRSGAAAILNVDPPIVFNPADPYMEAEPPIVEPGRRWRAVSKPEPVMIGDLVPLVNFFAMLKGLYDDVTGLSRPRLGGQTKSHQTAFAVDIEQSRGAVRTVDYVRSLMFGMLPTWLAMEYEMLRQTMPKIDVFIPKFEGYVTISKDMLPETVTFDVHGAGAPLEEREKDAKRANALQQALAVEMARRQLGEQGLDLEQLQRVLLSEGFLDVEQFFARTTTTVPGGVEGQPQVPGAAETLPGAEDTELLPPE